MPQLVLLHETLRARAEHLAQLYGLALLERLPEDEQFYLCLDDTGLSLKQGNHPRTSVQVSFSEGSNAHRRKFGGGMGQDLAKAMGLSSAYKPTVLDATAGLGRDAFVLASLGCTVTAYERQPVVAALLADGLARAAQDDEIAAIVTRIHLQFGQSHDLLQPAKCIEQMPDVVYLDPMFEHDEKQRAQVKKEMQAFRALVGQDNDAHALLDKALACARCRVVVKRARKAAPLAGREPSFALIGKANRFDIYTKAKVQALL